MRHRPEIDGLRAIAVLPVILFHARLPGFSGGFVGVDIFFVISGFLITSLILEDMARGDFSLLRFYERRARRILPALYLVLLVSMPFALALMWPDELREFGRYLVAVIFFVSNIRLWLSTDYFSPDAALNPLLHTWSLGVEEQFYMLFPLGLLILARLAAPARRPGLILGAIAALVLLGFAAAVLGWRREPEAAFYLLPTRAWQLGVGALLAAWLYARAPRLPGWARETGGSAGLALIAFATVTFDETTPFPTWPALVPTLGAALLLLCASPATLAGRLLCLRPLVAVGVISYSAYLWHQPLFAFARLAHPASTGPGTWAMAGLSAATLGLAALSWRFVEQPFRDRRRIGPRGILTAGLVSSAGIVALALALPALIRGTDAYPAPLRQLLVSHKARSAYVEAAYAQVRDRDFTDPARRNLLLIGDSHSQDLYNMIAETGAFPGYEVAARYIPARCQIYRGPVAAAEITPAEVARCPRVWDSIPPALAAEADLVLIAASWRPWAAAHLPATLAAYGFRPETPVFVFGRKGFTGRNLRRLLGTDPADLPRQTVEASAEQRASVEAIRAALPADRLIDMQALICGPGWTCPLFSPDGLLLSHDGSHLTRDGAAHVGRLVFSDPRLAPYAALPPAPAAPAR